MDERLQSVLDAVASGVWCQRDGGFYSYSQCAFCCVSPDSEHDEDCPVRIAREIQDEHN